jgi:hypothetical protein
MITKHNLIGLLVTSSLLTACAVLSPGADEVTGSGLLASEARAASDFTTIAFAGSGDARVVIGEPEGVVIEAEENLLPYITTQVSLGRLTIGTKPNVRLGATQPIHYRITIKHLEGIDLAGSGTVEIPQVSVDWLKFEIHGSGNIIAAGSTDVLEARLFGSGNITGKALRAGSAQVEIPGSGTVVVWATDQLNATINGSGTVRYYGQPSVTQVINGSGQVTRMGGK